MGSPALALACALAAASPALAREAREPAPARRYALTISGGASLGAYEAGATWAFVRYLRQLEAQAPAGVAPRLAVATGASAGSLNAALAAVGWCAATEGSTVDDNPFRRAWRGLDLDALLPAVPTSYQRDDALLARAALGPAERELREALTAPGARGCRVALGMTATAEQPLVTYVAGLPARDQTVALPLQIVAEPGGAPEVRSQRLPHQRVAGDRVLHLSGRAAAPGGEVQVEPEVVITAMKASGAFPFAFGAVALPMCVEACPAASAAPLRLCPAPDGPPVPGRACAGAYRDGGVFDNTPLQLAVALSEAQPGAAQEPTAYLYVDPDLRRTQTREARRELAPAAGAARELAFLAGAATFARERSLYEALHGSRWGEAAGPQPEGASAAAGGQAPARALILSRRFAPLTASLFLNFGAFIEAPFAEADYLVGVYDAGYGLASFRCGQGSVAAGATAFARDGAVDLRCLGAELERAGRALELPGSPVAWAVYRRLARAEARALAGAEPGAGWAWTADGAPGPLAPAAQVVEALLSQPRRCDPADAEPWCFADPTADQFVEALRARGYASDFADSPERWADERLVRLANRGLALEREPGFGRVAWAGTQLLVRSAYRGPGLHDPSTLPALSEVGLTPARLAAAALPHRLSVSVTTTQLAAAWWEPVLDLDARFALELRGDLATDFVHGPMVSLRPGVVVNRTGLLSASLGPAAGRTWPWWPAAASTTRLGVELGVGVARDRLRLVLTSLSGPGERAGAGWDVRLDVSDVAGIVYWLTRM
ncbi:patatin-like phospholipase family protein [Anaeromyxobacter diazotrophicus]|uniref:PNPLA domain-containing protein n=1 Tax=Anaeromyxobacter diazotrophicus TaxID=2590199 RepID=A0A7I9VQE6_9BACT|nr:patatin-like phospholipase family protein [Anaeromyxobacter diazotrophicus]GEJ58197.1 hypothetical protein AMYX_29380 [Anaeromyxobacter diazotrophicus]